MPLRALIFLPVLAVVSPALAQGPAQTGTGGGPTSTIYAPNTSAVGQTKPPGSAAGPATPDQEKRLENIEKKNDSIQSGICIGCDK